MTDCIEFGRSLRFLASCWDGLVFRDEFVLFCFIHKQFPIRTSCCVMSWLLYPTIYFCMFMSYFLELLLPCYGVSFFLIFQLWASNTPWILASLGTWWKRNVCQVKWSVLITIQAVCSRQMYTMGGTESRYHCPSTHGKLDFRQNVKKRLFSHSYFNS